MRGADDFMCWGGQAVQWGSELISYGRAGQVRIRTLLQLRRCCIGKHPSRGPGPLRADKELRRVGPGFWRLRRATVSVACFGCRGLSMI